ncbi:hypothetical protein DRQ36_02225 [bacterium]|nr:MAG: hypothetical protein DRQ36_02225 [bacterium]
MYYFEKKNPLEKIDSPYFDNDRPVLRDSIVVFVDILGSKELIREAEKSGESGELLRKVDRAIGDANSAFLYKFSGNKLCDIRMFSDNTAISMIAEKDEEFIYNLVSFLKAVTEYQIALAVEGIFARGGVSAGLVFSHIHLVWGPALVDAIEIEKNEAIYPRIILAEDIKERLLNLTGEAASVLKDFLLVDKNGVVFVNYLFRCKITEGEGWHDGEKKSSERALEILQKHQNNIQEALLKYVMDVKVSSKYSWLAEYHNWFCLEYFHNYPKLLINESIYERIFNHFGCEPQIT